MEVDKLVVLYLFVLYNTLTCKSIVQSIHVDGIWVDIGSYVAIVDCWHVAEIDLPNVFTW